MGSHQVPRSTQVRHGRFHPNVRSRELTARQLIAETVIGAYEGDALLKERWNLFWGLRSSSCSESAASLAGAAPGQRAIGLDALSQQPRGMKTKQE